MALNLFMCNVHVHIHVHVVKQDLSISFRTINMQNLQWLENFRRKECCSRKKDKHISGSVFLRSKLAFGSVTVLSMYV